MNNSMKDAADVLKAEPIAAVLTSGRSMRPMLRQHMDRVIIERKNRKLKRGDVPLYRVPTSKDLVLHRVIKCNKDGTYTMRGDNNYFTEHGVKDEDVVGVLNCFYRGAKFVDCTKSRGYKLYTFWILNSYFLRLPLIGGYRKLRPKISGAIPLNVRNKIKALFKK